MTKNKIAIIGAGHTGSTLAFIIAERALADVVLLEIPDNEKPARGKGRYRSEDGRAFSAVGRTRDLRRFPRRR